MKKKAVWRKMKYIKKRKREGRQKIMNAERNRNRNKTIFLPPQKTKKKKTNTRKKREVIRKRRKTRKELKGNLKLNK